MRTKLVLSLVFVFASCKSGGSQDTALKMGSEGNAVVCGTEADAENMPEDPERKLWKDIGTDPKAHNPNSFRYLIHTLGPHHIAENKRKSKEAWVEKLNSLYETIAKGNTCYDMSLSYINEKFVGSWGPAGFIMQTPIENIVSAVGHDAGTRNKHTSRDDALKERKSLFGYRGLASPSEVIATANKQESWYTEVVAVQKFSKKYQVKVVGMIADESHPIMRDAAKELARRKGLPYVELNLTVAGEK